MENASASWKKFLNPQTLKSNLTAAAVFITAYEILRQCLIEHLRCFFIDSGAHSLEELITPGQSKSYKEKVLVLDKREMVACAMWFRDTGALTDSDITTIQQVTDHRNEIAHDLLKLLSDANHDVDLSQLHAIYELVLKVDNWWIREVDIPTNPDMEDVELEETDLDAAISMRTMLLALLVQVAVGNDAALKEVYDQCRLSRMFS